MELESDNYISYTVSEFRDLASVKNLFRRNCYWITTHAITKLNGSKHDLKPLQYYQARVPVKFQVILLQGFQ